MFVGEVVENRAAQAALLVQQALLQRKKTLEGLGVKVFKRKKTDRSPSPSPERSDSISQKPSLMKMLTKRMGSIREKVNI